MKLFLLGAISRAFQPGCKFEIMLCLVGGQGAGKSTFFRLLAVRDEWFSDDLRKLDDDNVYRKLQGHWIIEMSEMMATANAKSIEEIKSFLSRQKEVYKIPYETHPADRPRQCVFGGTSNALDFLPLDRSGNRRFIPVMVYPEQAEVHILEDEAASRAYIEQMWAEAMEIYRSGRFKLAFSPAMQRYLKEHQRDFMPEDTKDACYSPVILIMNAAVVALVMLLSAAGSPEVRAFFGMSVGTAVAVIAYISQVFTPLESIGMEIETIQSAVAGVRRINGFLAQAERIPTAETAPQAVPGAPSVELQNVHFGYESDEEVLHGLSFAVQKGEQVTLTGRTGAGKSTIFKLLLGLYRPQQGKVMLNGVEAATLPDTARRPLVGYVEQSFRRVPGTVRDQITLFDAAITPQQAEDAARTVGLHDAIAALPEGYDTPCTPGIFSQGQWQLLSIARAIAAGPQILLLDEITANLDAGTEQTVLDALQRAGQNRTVVSISHRLYNRTGGRSIEI